MRRLVPLAVLLLGFIVGCAGGAAEAELAAPQSAANDTAAPADLPAPNELAKGASGFQKLLGSQVYLKQAGFVDDHTLYLSAPQYFPPPDGDPPKAPTAIGPARGASETAYHIAYGIFLFSAIDQQLATLEIDTGSNYKAKLWVGFADWDRNCWDFSAGGFFAHPTLDISNPASFDPFIDDEGNIAVAVVVDDPIEQVAVHSLEITLLTEVSDLEANNFRWDGVKMYWWAANSTDGFRVLRRLAGDLTGQWDLVSPPQLSRFDRSFKDTSASPGVDYTYLVQSGFLRNPNGVPHWYWSDGVSVNGRRQVSEVAIDAGAEGSHLPFLTGNKLGFFSQRSLDPGQVDGIRNQSFTPGTIWEPAGSPANNFTPFALVNDPEFGFPLMEHHAEQVNNPVTTLVYSTLDGTFAQIAERQEDDSLSWLAPLQVRQSNTIIVALVNMPRRIGAVTYNRSTGRLELVDSADINGRIWYEFEPETYPWMDIGVYKPLGRVSTNEHVADPILCFCDALTGELKYLEFDYTGWVDNSPPSISSGPGPVLADAAGILEMPTTVLFYLTPELDELRLIRSDIYDVWQAEEPAVLVAASPEEQIVEFALFTAGQISLESYLVYNISGRIYAQRTSSTSFADWSPPVLLDDSGSCRDLRIIKVGTDEEWDAHHYASYIKDSPDGGTLISFRDLYEATMDF